MFSGQVDFPQLTSRQERKSSPLTTLDRWQDSSESGDSLFHATSKLPVDSVEPEIDVNLLPEPSAITPVAPQISPFFTTASQALGPIRKVREQYWKTTALQVMEREAAQQAEIEEARIQLQVVGAENTRLRRRTDISQAVRARLAPEEQRDRFSQERLDDSMVVEELLVEAIVEQNRWLNQLAELKAEHDMQKKQLIDTMTKEKQQLSKQAESAKISRDAALKQVKEAVRAKMEAETVVESWKTKYDRLRANMVDVIDIHDGGPG